MRSSERKRQLKECIDIIRRAAVVIERKYIEQGMALSRISKHRLYQPEYKTFRQFCEVVLGLASQNVYQAIRAAETGQKVCARTHVELGRFAARVLSPSWVTEQQQDAIVLDPRFKTMSTRELQAHVGKLRLASLARRRKMNQPGSAPRAAGVLLGDCLDVLRGHPDESVQLIWTSPPYGDARRDYDTPKAAKYVEWFLPRAAEMLRVLKHTGSFVLNIKPLVSKGERNPYVFRLVLALQEQGWRHAETYIWRKNSTPGDYGKRLADGWEYLFHFAKDAGYDWFPEAAMRPAKWTAPEKASSYRKGSTNGSRFGRRAENWKNRTFAYPDNVIECATSTKAFKHPAIAPEGIVEPFINLFTQPGDVVLDPFAGSGTTGVVAQRMDRQFVLIENDARYVPVIEHRLRTTTSSAA